MVGRGTVHFLDSRLAPRCGVADVMYCLWFPAWTWMAPQTQCGAMLCFVFSSFKKWGGENSMWNFTVHLNGSHQNPSLTYPVAWYNDTCLLLLLIWGSARAVISGDSANEAEKTAKQVLLLTWLIAPLSGILFSASFFSGTKSFQRWTWCICWNEHFCFVSYCDDAFTNKCWECRNIL